MHVTLRRRIIDDVILFGHDINVLDAKLAKLLILLYSVLEFIINYYSAGKKWEAIISDHCSRKASADFTRDLTVLSRDFAVKITRSDDLKISPIFYRSDISLRKEI